LSLTVPKAVVPNEASFIVSTSATEGLLGQPAAKLNAIALEDPKKKSLKKVKPSTVQYMTTQDVVTIATENVLGFLEGTDKKDEIVVITAHYDHIGKLESGKDRINNGADDDGSGTVTVMELAKIFAEAKREGNGPRRSILFMTVSGEEKGLLGSD